jgi:hypothetical protein
VYKDVLQGAGVLDALLAALTDAAIICDLRLLQVWRAVRQAGAPPPRAADRCRPAHNCAPPACSILTPRDCKTPPSSSQELLWTLIALADDDVVYKELFREKVRRRRGARARQAATRHAAAGAGTCSSRAPGWRQKSDA